VVKKACYIGKNCLFAITKGVNFDWCRVAQGAKRDDSIYIILFLLIKRYNYGWDPSQKRQ